MFNQSAASRGLQFGYPTELRSALATCKMFNCECRKRGIAASRGLHSPSTESQSARPGLSALLCNHSPAAFNCLSSYGMACKTICPQRPDHPGSGDQELDMTAGLLRTECPAPTTWYLQVALVEHAVFVLFLLSLLYLWPASTASWSDTCRDGLVAMVRAPSTLQCRQAYRVLEYKNSKDAYRAM
jgi:hypothetical protein